jgi:hypothetical protein
VVPVQYGTVNMHAVKRSRDCILMWLRSDPSEHTLQNAQCTDFIESYLVHKFQLFLFKFFSTVVKTYKEKISIMLVTGIRYI